MIANNDDINILSRGQNHIIVYKPPKVICHHCSWAGSRKKKSNNDEVSEIPMLQRVRDKIDEIDNERSKENFEIPDDGERMKRRVNLVHRLDRGTSGALLFAFADSKEIEQLNIDDFSTKTCKGGATTALQDQLSQSSSTKTYIAIVRGEGILRGENLKERGWFEVNRPIKDEKGRLNDATTQFYFIAGQKSCPNDDVNIPRLSLVLARPGTGRWHQIRRHLNGLSHHILGDGTHGCSKTNKEWKEKRNISPGRLFLHLARLQIPATKFTPIIDCPCPIPLDMLQLLEDYAPNVLREALPVLEEEGIKI